MAYLAALHWTNAGRKLVQSNDFQEIRHLEQLLHCTQADAVDHYIEESCSGEDLPKFRGGKGSPAERLAALRALWSDYDGDEE